jgi:hypothetical protein
MVSSASWSEKHAQLEVWSESTAGYISDVFGFPTSSEPKQEQEEEAGFTRESITKEQDLPTTYECPFSAGGYMMSTCPWFE